MKAYVVVEVLAPPFLTSALDGAEWQTEIGTVKSHDTMLVSVYQITWRHIKEGLFMTLTAVRTSNLMTMTAATTDDDDDDGGDGGG
jgi:hypothetical protein